MSSDMYNHRCKIQHRTPEMRKPTWPRFMLGGYKLVFKMIGRQPATGQEWHNLHQ
jgi:hypothetical protein